MGSSEMSDDLIHLNLLPAISTKQMQAILGRKIILHQINLTVPQGQWTSIIGANGAGKTTLLKALAGLLAHENEVRLFGQVIETIPKQERAKKLAWLGQNEVITNDILVYDLVMLGRLPHQNWLGTSSTSDHEAVKQSLHTTNSWPLRQRPFSELSGGERQRVLISRALAVNAQIILMDEPLSNLDPPHQTDLMNIIKSLILDKKTVVTVLHDISFALHAEQIIIIQDGKLMHQGPAADALTHNLIEEAFQHRIKIYPLNQSWVTVPHFP
jgi:iron complex transport system ATP-binding protein